MIICFIGERGAGKDTAADALRIYDFKKHAFADGVRAVAETVFGITQHEMADRVLKISPLGRGAFADLTVRQILQRIGTECFRDQFPGVWVDRLLRRTENVSKVVVPDTRFWDEHDALRARGAIFVRIDNPNVTETGSEHRSEIEWREFPVDHVLVNDHATADEFSLAVIDFYAKLCAPPAPFVA